MMKVSKILVIMLAILMAVSTLAGCGSNGGSAANGEEKTTLTFWTQDTIPWQNYFEPAVERFEAENPNIDIKIEYFATFADKTNQAFAAGTESDVVFTWQAIADWAASEKILEVPESVYTKDEMKELFYEGAVINKMHDDKYYAVSNEINVESPSLYVNMDILNERGISLPENWIDNNGPETWDELIEFAKTLTVKNESGVVTNSGLSYAYAQWEAMLPSLIWQLGGDYRDEANNTVNFKTDEAYKAVEFMLSYLGDAPETVCTGTTSRYDEFVQGTAAMCIGAPWYAGGFSTDIPDVNYQVFNVPPFIDGADPACMATGGWGYMVSSNCENPDVAWEFVKFMTSAEEVGEWAITTGALPSRTDALTDLEFDVNVGSVEKAIGISKDVLPFSNEEGAYLMTPSTLTYTIIREALFQVLLDGDIDACLDRIQSEAERMIEENNRG